MSRGYSAQGTIYSKKFHDTSILNKGRRLLFTSHSSMLSSSELEVRLLKLSLTKFILRKVISFFIFEFIFIQLQASSQTQFSSIFYPNGYQIRKAYALALAYTRINTKHSIPYMRFFTVYLQGNTARKLTLTYIPCTRKSILGFLLELEYLGKRYPRSSSMFGNIILRIRFSIQIRNLQRIS